MSHAGPARRRTGVEVEARPLLSSQVLGGHRAARWRGEGGAPAAQHHRGSMQGTKYDPARSTNDIAKAIRADIKAAMGMPSAAPWALPKGLKVSVRLDKFAGGCSIKARITAFPGALLNPAAVVGRKLLRHEPLWYPRLTKEGARVVAVLDALMAAYNYDRSDPQSDYFSVRFYGDAEVHHEYAEQRKLELLASPHLSDLLADLGVTVAAGELEMARRIIATLNEGYDDAATERREVQALLFPSAAMEAA